MEETPQTEPHTAPLHHRLRTGQHHQHAKPLYQRSFRYHVLEVQSETPPSLDRDAPDRP